MKDSAATYGSGVIIELFGAPGIGKSYLAKELAACFKDNGTSVNDRCIAVGVQPRIMRIIFKIRIIVPMLVLMPKTLPILLSFILKTGIKGLPAIIKVLFNWLYIVALICLEIKEQGIVILDQGITQALWSTVFRGNIVSANITRKLFTSILQTCGIRQLVVVHLSLDPEIHRMRLISRLNGYSPLDDGDPEKFEYGLMADRSVSRLIEQVANNSAYSLLYKLDFQIDGNNNSYHLHKKLIDVLSSTYWTSHTTVGETIKESAD